MGSEGRMLVRVFVVGIEAQQYINANNVPRHAAHTAAICSRPRLNGA